MLRGLHDPGDGPRRTGVYRYCWVLLVLLVLLVERVLLGVAPGGAGWEV
ncbi:hypothetical protein [Streptomyces sp. NPDC001919]